ncbi:DUF3426 domain-containing protein [Luteimonas aestuarii]|uniref:DUF3426 domain-containing protein n=1 Tax=Luteimonas aestuarii TaxID=453837 RepID=A0A4R5TKP1_9GAMM|nr:DUF3426 domain-containing protein [Luteimonas aestuarii]TDK22706.1 DUF3426 domain-containing protein [Luteimonas aestuarii]
MFINCRHCNALVATDPATDAPPERCPRCQGALRESDAPAQVPDAASPSADGDQAAPTQPTAEPIETLHDGEAAAPEDGAGNAAREHSDDPDGAWRRAADLVAALARRDDLHDGDDAAQDAPGFVGAPLDEDSGLSPGAATVSTDASTVSPTVDTADVTRVDAAEGGATRPVQGTQSEDIQSGNVEGLSGALVPTPPAASQDPSTKTDPAAPRSKASAPSFAASRHASAPATPRRRWVAPAAIGALSALLILQILLADRARLSMDASWRPLLATLCGALGCNLPPWREPAAFHLVARDVRAHPTQPGVLRATATLRNDARWPQAWPRVVLTLSDVEGRSIGMRDFAPDEYLGEMPTEATLSSGQSAMIRLDVREPAANVVAFSFDFH